MPVDLRSDAQAILRQALDAVDPGCLFKEQVRRDAQQLIISDIEVDLGQVRKVLVVGTGKGAAPLARAAEEVLGDRLGEGAITVKYGHALPLKKIEVFEAGHPVPDRATLRGTKRILDILDQAGEGDLVLALITGGGSALLERPAPGLSLRYLQITTEALLACGARIADINAVRTHLSQVKGGQLLRAAFPARVISLLISDVIGDAPGAIASGPTAPDSTTFKDAWGVIAGYSLEKKLPAAVIRHIRRGCAGQIPDTPKADDPIFERSTLKIIGTNRIMLQAAQRKAQALGYRALILTDKMEGDASQAGRRLAILIESLRARQRPTDRAICLLAGGETTVVLKGDGVGGRCQELALAAAIELAGMPDCLLLAAGSDGTDGPTEAAGAIVDGTTIRRAAGRGLDPINHLNHSDAYPFFQALGDLIITGPTLTNVMDLVIMMIRPPRS